jgi:hypothetical protein
MKQPVKNRGVLNRGFSWKFLGKFLILLFKKGYNMVTNQSANRRCSHPSHYLKLTDSKIRNSRFFNIVFPPFLCAVWKAARPGTVKQTAPNNTPFFWTLKMEPYGVKRPLYSSFRIFSFFLKFHFQFLTNSSKQNTLFMDSKQGTMWW